MCGRMCCTLHPEKVARIGGASLKEPIKHFRPKYNLTPQNTALILTEERQCERQVCEASWGLLFNRGNSGVLDATYNTINARSEGISTSRLYSPLLKSNRCVVLADGYYEWKNVQTLGKPNKVPYFFRCKSSVKEHCVPFCEEAIATGKEYSSRGVTVKDEKDFGIKHDMEDFAAKAAIRKAVLSEDGAPLMMAGLYQKGIESPSPIRTSFTILTMESDKCDIFEVHNRMPVLLTPYTAARWLACSSVPFESCIEEMLMGSNAFCAANIEFYQVSKLVSSIRNDQYECTIRKAAYEAQQMAKLFGEPRKRKSQTLEGHAENVDAQEELMPENNSLTQKSEIAAFEKIEQDTIVKREASTIKAINETSVDASMVVNSSKAEDKKNPLKTSGTAVGAEGRILSAESSPTKAKSKKRRSNEKTELVDANAKLDFYFKPQKGPQ